VNAGEMRVRVEVEGREGRTWRESRGGALGGIELGRVEVVGARSNGCDPEGRLE
jgi:hypothetical protein